MTQDHPLRGQLTEEMHARRLGNVQAPCEVTQLLAVYSEGEQQAVRQHALKIAGRPEEACTDFNHLAASIAGFEFTWECHAEFATYTFIRSLDATDDQAEFAPLPPHWMADLPAVILRGTQLRLLSVTDPEPTTLLEDFHPGDLVTCDVFDKAATIWADFRLHNTGFGKLVIKDRHLSDGDATRLVQWLQELGNYRKMALLGLPLAKELGGRLKRLEDEFGSLVNAIAMPDRQSDAELFHALSSMTAELNRLESDASYRMSATMAYSQIVHDRLTSLRESRVAGHQTLSEFTERRFMPAIRTCQTFMNRVQQVSRRADSASGLMRTSIDVVLRGQTRDLLASMDRRSGIQLRLQQAVEGLSVTAITYYMAALLHYELEALHHIAPYFNPTIVLAFLIPLLILMIWRVVRSKRQQVT
ncbi:DUF3422 family protein [Sphingobium sp. 15-1]|uniref:DUF3422 family protein n=1 Tax=Sphingobium sp. 15-1 TaxID=2729616 RepID=UPI001C3F5FE7|nr:DUF3422 domain-containing protein [Sphingobium sp. 15-1]